MNKFKILILGEVEAGALTLLDSLASGAHSTENLCIGGENLGQVAVKETNSIAAYTATLTLCKNFVAHGFAGQVDRIVVLIDANNSQCQQQLETALACLASAQLIGKTSVCLTHASAKAQYARRYKLKSYALMHGVKENMVRNLATNDSNAVQSYIEQLAQRSSAPSRTFMLKAACA